MDETEIEKLKREHATMKRVLQSLLPEHSGHFFITGADKIDEYGLPSYVLICPTYGSDYVELYRKRGLPGWKKTKSDEDLKDGSTYLLAHDPTNKDGEREYCLIRWIENRELWIDDQTHCYWPKDSSPTALFECHIKL